MDAAEQFDRDVDFAIVDHLPIVGGQEILRDGNRPRFAKVAHNNFAQLNPPPRAVREAIGLLEQDLGDSCPDISQPQQGHAKRSHQHSIRLEDSIKNERLTRSFDCGFKERRKTTYCKSRSQHGRASFCRSRGTGVNRPDLDADRQERLNAGLGIRILCRAGESHAVGEYNLGWENIVMMTTSTNGTVRIGAVNYLNSKPLIEGLAELLPDAELTLDYPSRLADDLEAGHLDVALIPSIEVFRHANYEVVSDACVATRGPVLSVKLYSRVPFGEIRSLALDEGSRTSAALAQIMLEERFGVRPRLQPLPLEQSPTSCQTDAVLVIGDRAMHPPQERFAATWDLGEEWLRWSGLPFVFAVWAARSGAELGGVDEALCRARELGIKRSAEIAHREAPLLGIKEATAYDYLTKNLHFRLGSAERSGLRLFRCLSSGLGLVPEGVDIVFRDCTPT